MTSILIRAGSDLATCIAFYTRLPIRSTENRRFAEAQWAAPLAGLVVALIGGAAYWIARYVSLQPGIAAALALAAMMLATGCLHEDGLADVADGFGGGRTRERKLEIMRDSRIGTYGVAALATALLLRWSALSGLATPGAVILGLIAAHMASRALLPAFMMLVLPARPGGLSANIGAISPSTSVAALGIGLLALLPLGIRPAIIAALLLFLSFVLLRNLCERQIGGQTGDVLGMVQQVAEIIVLLVASAFAA